jgi:hypothetical protein
MAAMRPLSRPPSPFRATVALAVIVLSAAAITYCFWQIHGILFQVYALAALFLAFRYCPPVVGLIKRMPVPHRAVFFVMLAGVVIGHFTLSTRRYYPFVAWDIFAATSEKNPVECRELIGTTADGKSVRLLVEQLFPSITQFNLPPRDQPEQMEHLVHALAKVYNERHTSDPLNHVDLMLMAVELHLRPDRSLQQPSCELLQRYDISLDR